MNINRTSKGFARLFINCVFFRELLRFLGRRGNSGTINCDCADKWNFKVCPFSKGVKLTGFLSTFVRFVCSNAFQIE